MTKKRRLGRGLASLIPDADFGVSRKRPGAERSPEVVPIDQISPNPHQPRADFDQTSLSSLADSIKQHGMLQPLLVRKTKDGYELIIGERRLRAAS